MSARPRDDDERGRGEGEGKGQQGGRLARAGGPRADQNHGHLNSTNDPLEVLVCAVARVPALGTCFFIINV